MFRKKIIYSDNNINQVNKTASLKWKLLSEISYWDDRVILKLSTVILYRMVYHSIM